MIDRHSLYRTMCHDQLVALSTDTTLTPQQKNMKRLKLFGLRLNELLATDNPPAIVKSVVARMDQLTKEIYP